MILLNLPHSIIAHIFSYNIQNVSDIAQFRLVHPTVARDVLPYVPLYLTFARCCNRMKKGCSFVEELMNIQYEGLEVPIIGSLWTLTATDEEMKSRLEDDTWRDWGRSLDSFPIFEDGNVKVLSILFLDNSFSISELSDGKRCENRISAQCNDSSSSYTAQNLLDGMANASSVKELLRLRDEGENLKLFAPDYNREEIKNQDDTMLLTSDTGGVFYRAVISSAVPAKYGHSNAFTSLQLKIVSKWYGNDNLRPTMDNFGKDKRAYVAQNTSTGRPTAVQLQGKSFLVVRVALRLAGFGGEVNVLSYQLPYRPLSLQFQQLLDAHQYQSIKEGVAVVDGIVSHSLHVQLMQDIERVKENQNPPDYHPYSDRKVRDIVHPSLYCFVQGVTPIESMAEDNRLPHSMSAVCHVKENISCDETDFWGRKYECSKYQWLPTYFDIDIDGKCSISDYINNLVPRSRYSSLYSSLEELFAIALPFVESVYSYVRCIHPRIRTTAFDVEHLSTNGNEPHFLPDERLYPLRGRRLQVITKIVDYELRRGESFEGVWHVEGTSHEEIIATSLYVLHRDRNIVGGDILFKRAFHENEAAHLFITSHQDRPKHMEYIIEQGLSPLGKTETLPGRLIVFPNSHVHRVDAIKNVASELHQSDSSTSQISKRRIVVFFLVNPDNRIVSTREVKSQQLEAGGKMSLAEARQHRLDLMQERKFAKQDYIVRAMH